MPGGRPPRRGEGSTGSVNENAKANAVGVGCVRCARAHFAISHLACAKRLPNRSSSPSGALRALASADSTILPERSAWKKNFTRVDKFLLTWQVSRVSDEGVAVRMGGARLGQRSARAPTIFSSADVAALRVEPCSGEAAESCFCHRCGVRSTQEMILGSTEPQCACSAQLCCPRGR